MFVCGTADMTVWYRGEHHPVVCSTAVSQCRAAWLCRREREGEEVIGERRERDEREREKRGGIKLIFFK